MEKYDFKQERTYKKFMTLIKDQNSGHVFQHLPVRALL